VPPQYPVINKKLFAEENVKTISVSPPPAQASAARLFAEPESSKPVSSQPSKSKKRSPAILFGILICVFVIGIVSTYFVGQWLSTKMSSDSQTKEIDTIQGVSNKTETSLEAAPEAISPANTNTAASSRKPENKTVVETKNLPPKKSDTKPAAPRPVQPNNPSPAQQGKSEIFQ
jgi:cytoskeletal protein RodZ